MFNGMAQFYQCFIKKFASMMAPIKKLLRKIEIFEHGLLNVKLLGKTSRIGSFKFPYSLVLIRN